MPKILTMGEVLIDFTQSNIDGMTNVFQQNAGGAGQSCHCSRLIVFVQVRPGLNQPGRDT